MCLVKSDTKTAEFRHQMVDSITCYKMITTNNRSQYYNYYWQPGWNISDRQSMTDDTTVGPDTVKIKHGMHVYLHKPTLISILSLKMIEVQCNKEDLVGVNLELTEAVFTKVYWNG